MELNPTMTRLKLVPVCCSCGYVFKDGVKLTYTIEKVDSIQMSKYGFNPMFCPSCQKEIECIEYYDYES